MLSPSADEVKKSLQSIFRKKIPSGKAIATSAVDRALAGHETDTEWIKENFSRLVEDVQSDAYKDYQQQEAVAGGEALVRVFRNLAGKNASVDDILGLLYTEFGALDKFFLGLTQGRRPRAGKTFEELIKTLFTKLHYPFTPQAIINGQPDFVLPSIDHYRNNPVDCVIFTVKRTLRERWRQIVTEGTRGLGFFLATIDEQVGRRDLGEMLQSRIILVVPERIKNAVANYEQTQNVVTFEYFFQHYLDPAMERWRAAGAI